jgi:DNA polymerase-1
MLNPDLLLSAHDSAKDNLLKDYRLIVDPADIPEVMEHLSRVPVYALDVETSGLDHMRASIHGIALASEDREYYVCLGAEKAILPHLHDVVGSDKTIIMHNASFDLHFLRRYKINPVNVVDTMIGQFLVDENQSVGLKNLARTKLGIREEIPDFKDLLRLAKRLTGRKKLEEVTVYDVPLDTLALYAARDGRFTYDLWNITHRELHQEGMLDQFNNVEMPFMHVITDMEEAGFYIDRPALQSIGDEFRAKQQTALDTWNRITNGVNPNSTPQLVRYLYDEMGYEPSRSTDSGAPSTDIMSLTRLLPYDKNGAVKAIVDYRKFDKLVSTYIISFENQMLNGILYGKFNQTGTVTGRLSSSDPNLQNIPARGEEGDQIRSLFRARPGYSMVVIDYSQIELRLIAHYTRDARMLKVFEDGGDPHQATVDLLTNLGYKLTRKDAKQVNFGWAYGIGPRKLQDTIEKATGNRPTMDEAKAWLDGFAKAYPGATSWKRAVIRAAQQIGYVRTIAGRKRRLPEINSSDRALAGLAERQAVNSIIQGSASDVIKYAMIQTQSPLKKVGGHLLAQVHDELVFEIPEADANEFASDAGRIMEHAGEVVKCRVNLIAEPGIGVNWSSAKH